MIALSQQSKYSHGLSYAQTARCIFCILLKNVLRCFGALTVPPTCGGSVYYSQQIQHLSSPILLWRITRLAEFDHNDGLGFLGEYGHWVENVCCLGCGSIPCSKCGSLGDCYK